MLNNLNRFELEDLSRKGYRLYAKNISSPKDRESFSKVLYYRWGLENFFIGNILAVKDRRHSES